MTEPEDTPPTVHGDDLTWTEVADVLWLAAAIRDPRAASSAAPDDAAEAEPAAAQPEPPPPRATGPEEPPLEQALRDAAETAASGGVPASPPDMGTYLRVSSVARALRPLRVRVDSRTEQVLDEERVAVRAAETDMWWPVTRPATVRWFDAVLLVDTSASMALWRRTAVEFQHLLERLGAFRNVRVCWVDTDEATVDTYTSGGAVRRNLAGLLDPGGKRLIFVLTDGVGRAWRPGALAGWLPQLGATNPLVVVNMLPQRLWRLGNLATEQMVVAADRFAGPNRSLRYRSKWDAEPADDALPVPVLELDPSQLARWTSLVAATGRVSVELPVTLVRAGIDEPEPAPVDMPATDRVREFHLTASSQAFRLASFLAAVPVTRAVMQVVQKEMVRDATLPHIAEVMLSGLLVPATHGAAEYEFRDGVREELLGALRRADTAWVVRVVAASLADNLPAVAGLLDAIADPAAVQLPDDPAARALHYAVRRALSGAYRPPVKLLSRTLDSGSDASRSMSATIIEAGLASDMAEPPPSSPTRWAERIPHRDRNFVDRSELAEVRELLDGVPLAPVVLRGEPGVGKSAIAAEYAYRHSHYYAGVWWFPAHEPATIVAAYHSLAERLGLTGAHGIAAVEAVRAAIRDVARYGQWLMIFDDAGAPELLHPYLPPGAVIVTSRDPAWQDYGDVVAVGAFTPEQSWQLLRRNVFDFDEDEADRLGDVLARHPAAVAHAARWLKSSRMRPVEYRDAVAPGAVCGPALDEIGDGPARPLLDLCAVLGPAPVPREYFFGQFDDPMVLSRAVRDLTLAGLVVVNHEQNTISTSALVRTEVLARQESPELVRHHAHEILAEAPLSVDLLPHLLATGGADHADCAVLRIRWLELVAHLKLTGDPDNAADLAGTTRAAWTAALGADHPDTVAMTVAFVRNSRLAAVLGDTAIAPDIRAIQEELVTRLRAERGEHDPATLMAVTDLAITACLGGEPTRLARDTLPHARVELGEEDPVTIACAIAAANELAATGDDAAARELDEATATLWEEHLGTWAARLNLARDQTLPTCHEALGAAHPLSRLAELPGRVWYDPEL